MSYEQIPLELRVLNQWILWKYEDIGAAKPTKVPYSINGTLANVNEKSTWATFEEVCQLVPRYSGIGFVFSDKDEFSFIDLDDTSGDTIAYDRQIKIYREFDSWSEVSPSGRGLHIIVKGFVPAGRRRNFIEVYSSQRYATFTGNVYNDKPIKDCQDKLTQLWEQMGSGGVATNIYKGDDKEKFNDKEVIEQATNAVNGEKFKSLFSGEWNGIYQSQSEADYALIDIIAFYTQNKNQIQRIFRSSQLGKRDKAKRSDYIGYMIQKSFDRMLPPIDFEGFKIELEKKLQLQLPLAGKDGDAFASGNGLDIRPLPASNSPVGAITLPPGLLGKITEFIYAAAPRPVPEIALAAAIGLMAGVCGRAYNISGTGLNQYVLLLAATGTGKEAMRSGINKLMNVIRFQVPTSNSYLGPSEIASGQALVKHLSKTSQCFISILGEFGLRLESMSSPNANNAEKMLKRLLVDLYNVSGEGEAYGQSVFADTDKNTVAIQSPSFTILGDSPPEVFYSALSEEMISSGLLPRFLLIEYDGIRPPLSGTHTSAIPSMMLTEQLASLIAHCENMSHSNPRKACIVNISQEALSITAQFDKYADAQINNTTKEVIRHLWNRAHIKVLKLSALIAVGINMSDPVILPEYVQWAMDLVQKDIRALLNKFEEGLVGHNTFEIKQNIEVARMIKDFVIKDWEFVKKYCQGKNMEQLYKAKIVPYSYLNKRLAGISCFKNDRGGATVGLKRAIQLMLDSDKIREVGKAELAVKHGTSQRGFMISDTSLLD